MSLHHTANHECKSARKNREQTKGRSKLNDWIIWIYIWKSGKLWRHWCKRNQLETNRSRAAVVEDLVAVAIDRLGRNPSTIQDNSPHAAYPKTTGANETYKSANPDVRIHQARSVGRETRRVGWSLNRWYSKSSKDNERQADAWAAGCYMLRSVALRKALGVV